MKMAAIRPARWPGAARALTVRSAPSVAVPKPAPATAVPARKAAADVVSIAARVSMAPASRSRQPASMAAGPLTPRNTTGPAAPVPATRKITSPPHSRSGEPTTCAASDGPSDRQNPLSIHAAIRHGSAIANVPRACRGTATRGRSAASTPAPDTVSGIASTATAAARLTPSSSHQTRWVGAGPYWTSALVPSPPAASPSWPAAMVITGAIALPSGCRSTSAAPSALVAVPTAAPCNARAANSIPTPCAARNNPHAPAAITRLAHPAAAQVVRHRPEHQQRDQQDEGVNGEDRGQRDRREPPLGLVDAIQRRRGGRREEQQDEHPGHQPEPARPRQRRPPHTPSGSPGPAPAT